MPAFASSAAMIAFVPPLADMSASFWSSTVQAVACQVEPGTHLAGEDCHTGVLRTQPQCLAARDDPVRLGGAYSRGPGGAQQDPGSAVGHGHPRRVVPGAV